MFRLNCARKSAFDVPKELAFEQVFGVSAAIDDDEWIFGSIRLSMDFLGDEFFARARFAFDDDGGVGGRNFFENPVDFSHFDVSADDIAEFFFVRWDDGDFFVEGLEDEFGLPEAE